MNWPFKIMRYDTTHTFPKVEYNCPYHMVQCLHVIKILQQKNGNMRNSLTENIHFKGFNMNAKKAYPFNKFINSLDCQMFVII